MVGVHPMGLNSENKFHMGDYLQAWQESPSGRIVTSKHYNGCLQDGFCSSFSSSYKEYHLHARSH